MDRPGPEFDSFDDHSWGLPPPPSHQFHDRDYPPPPGAGAGFHPGDGGRHRHGRRHDYNHAEDYRDEEQYHHYGGPGDEWFGANGELGHGHGYSRPHHLPRKRRAAPYDHDGGNYVKLFVGGVPSTITEEELRLLFEEYGSVVEVVLCWDKWTGQQKEFSFVKYASFEEADSAIKALHDIYIWPGTIVPLRVKYADGEKERMGTFSTPSISVTKSLNPSANPRQKVYVNNLNKQASREEIAEIFSHYGEVEDVYIMVDEFKQSRGCGFVGFSHRDMASAAIEGLNGSYVMRGCDRALVVRFADPKKPRQGEIRSAPCGNTGTSPAALHTENLGPSAENAASARGGTPVNMQANHIVLHEPHFQRIQPQDSQAINLSSRSASKPQPASIASDKKNAVLPPSQLTLERASGTAVVEGIPNCDWSEHVCPEGYKYYYNCMTFESRWEKPEELTLHEQKLQSLYGQQPLSMSSAITIQFRCWERSSFLGSLASLQEHIHEKVHLERGQAMSPPVVQKPSCLPSQPNPALHASTMKGYPLISIDHNNSSD